MKLLLILVISIISVFYSYAQQYITISGKITDSQTGKPVSFASIGLKSRSIGVISGNDGEFTFHIPIKAKNDSLIILMLGYEKYTESVAQIANKKEFKLKPSTYTISEVQVKELTANYILKQAWKNIHKNYSDKPFMGKCDYQQYIEENDKFVRAYQAATQIYFDDLKDKGLTCALKVDSAMYSIDNTNKKYHIYNSAMTQYLFYFGTTLKHLTKEESRIDSIFYSNGERIYVISSGKNKEIFSEFHDKIYINQDFAVLKVDFSYSMKPEKIEIKDDRAPFWAPLGFAFTAIYEKHDDIFFPKYLEVNTKAAYYKEKDNTALEFTRSFYNKFLITEIQTENIQAIKDMPQGDIFKVKVDKMKNWINYNALPNSDVRTKAFNELNISK